MAWVAGHFCKLSLIISIYMEIILPETVLMFTTILLLHSAKGNHLRQLHAVLILLRMFLQLIRLSSALIVSPLTSLRRIYATPSNQRQAKLMRVGVLWHLTHKAIFLLATWAMTARPNLSIRLLLPNSLSAATILPKHATDAQSNNCPKVSEDK